MATYTDNYNLTKPTMNELADIRVINGNMDTVDTVMHGAQVSIADAYDPTLTYDVGDLVMNDFLLYKCVTAVTTPEAFDANKWTRTTAAAEGSGGGGGGNYTADVLFENTDFTVPSGSSNVINTYTLENSIDDYDAVLVEAFLYVTPSIKANSQTMLIPSDDCYSQNTDKEWDFLMFADNFSGNTQGRRRIGFGFPSSTSIKVVGQRITENECPMLYKVIGFKFGSGGGGINYSTTEQNTGLKWIDGSDIYQITISDTMPIVSTDGTFVSKLINPILSSVDAIIGVDAIIKNGGNDYLKLPYITNSGRIAKFAFVSNSMQFQLTSDGTVFSENPCVINVQYTKVTTP